MQVEVSTKSWSKLACLSCIADQVICDLTGAMQVILRSELFRVQPLDKVLGYTTLGRQALFQDPKHAVSLQCIYIYYIIYIYTYLPTYLHTYIYIYVFRNCRSYLHIFTKHENVYIYTKHNVYIWRFPEIGVPP